MELNEMESKENPKNEKIQCLFTKLSHSVQRTANLPHGPLRSRQSSLNPKICLVPTVPRTLMFLIMDRCFLKKNITAITLIE